MAVELRPSNGMGGLWNRFLTSVGIRKSLGPLAMDNWFWMPPRLMMEQTEQLDFPYKQLGWVYASIRTIAENIARLPFKVYTGDDDNPKEVKKGPLYDLFLNPNPFMTQEQLWEATLIFLGLYGECFWVLTRDNITQVPTEIWTFNPSRFEPVWDKDRKVLLGWKYTAGPNDVFVFRQDQILQFKYYNPYDDLRGLSPLDSIKIALDYDYYSDIWNKTYFKNGVRVSGFIQVPESMTDEEFNRLEMQVSDKHQGPSKAHKIAIITNGGTFQEAKILQKDMDFPNMKKMTRELVFGVMKTNAVVMGLYQDIQSYEGVKTAHKMFWEECLQPKIKYLEGVTWAKLCSKITGGREWCAFDITNVEAFHDYYATRILTAEKMAKIGWTANAINAKLGLGMADVPWGDVWWAPMNMVPIDSPEKPMLPAPGPAKPPAEGGGSSPAKPKPTKDEELYRAAWSRYMTKQAPMEDLLKGKLSRLLFDQRKAVLSAVYSGKTEDIFSKVGETKRFTRLFYAFYPMCLKVGHEMLVEEIGDIPGNEFDIQLPETLNYFEARIKKIPNEIVSRIGMQVDKILEESKGASAEEIAYKIRELYNKIGKRVITIARTETSAVINAGRVLQMQKQGVTYHRWVSSRNEKSRQSHKDLDGKVVKLGDSFLREYTLRWPCDMYAPAEEIINCLCFTIAEKEGANG